MKHLLVTLLATISFLSVSAQDSTLNKYTGKYKFPEGSPVTEITVTVENGTLMAASAMGATEFKKTDTPDVFEVVVYGGTATFKKNAEGKVTGVSISAGGTNMEGTKVEGIDIKDFLDTGNNTIKMQSNKNQLIRK